MRLVRTLSNRFLSFVNVRRTAYLMRSAPCWILRKNHSPWPKTYVWPMNRKRDFDDDRSRTMVQARITITISVWNNGKMEAVVQLCQRPPDIRTVKMWVSVFLPVGGNIEELRMGYTYAISEFFLFWVISLLVVLEGTLSKTDCMNATSKMWPSEPVLLKQFYGDRFWMKDAKTQPKAAILCLCIEKF